MGVKDRIKKIEPYFKEMQIVTVEDSQIIYIVVEFPIDWVIADDLEETYNVSVGNGNYGGEYIFCTPIDNGEEKIFDAIEENIEKMKEAIERSQLLGEKIKELRNIFEDENVTINQLRQLKMELPEHNEIIQIGKKKEKNKNEETEKKDE